MKVYLAFSELEKIIASKIGKPVGISFSSHDTIVVSVDFLLSVEVKLKVLSIDNSLLVLKYDGGLAIKSVLSGLLMLLQNKLPMLGYDDDRKILIHLDKITNFNKVADNVEFKGISFDDSNVIIEGNLLLNGKSFTA